MTDITQRLRDPSGATSWAAADALAEEAAAEIDRLRAALRDAVPALESCLEDSLQVINERARDWGQYKLTLQRQMAAEYETHRAVLEAARAALGE